MDGLTHTQTVGGFFGRLSAIRAAYHGVSGVASASGLTSNEHAWRYKQRTDRNTMYRDLLETASTKPCASSWA